MSSFTISALEQFVEILFNKFLFNRILEDGFLRKFFNIFFLIVKKSSKKLKHQNFEFLKWENGSKNWGENNLFSLR